MADDKHYMQLALDACRHGIQTGQTPFGACIVRDDRVIACTHNHVWITVDPTAHAEVWAIRLACREQQNIHLEGATIYSTTEPCPMCFAAIHWARIERIVCGARIEDAQRFGFNELPISNAALKELGHASIELQQDFMRDEAVALFELWQQQENHKTY